MAPSVGFAMLSIVVVPLTLWNPVVGVIVAAAVRSAPRAAVEAATVSATSDAA